MTPVATWVGGSVNGTDWTDTGNWVGNVAPSAGDDLVFPSSPNLVAVDDFPFDTTFNSIKENAPMNSVYV